MQTIAILEPVPAFFRKELAELGFHLWDVDVPSLKTAEKTDATIKGLVIRSKSAVDERLMKALPDLSFILRPGSGLENIDQNAARKRNITLINSPEGNKHAVGEHALGMLLGMLHHIPRACQAVKNGKWDREINRGIELRHLQVGIVGYGHTGQVFAEKLKGIGCEVLVYDKYRKLSANGIDAKVKGQDELFQQADVISFHVPYNSETHHYFHADILKGREKPVYLINTSRGSIICSQSLLTGLENGLVQGACLDVLETEDYDEPGATLTATTDALKARDAVLITPHVAGWSYHSEIAIYQGLTEKLKALYGSA